MSGIELSWRAGETEVRWRAGGATVVRTFPVPPATVTVWTDPPSVVVVEAIDYADTSGAARLDNAVVYEPDGTERLRLAPPRVVAEPIWNLGFYAVFPSTEGLVAVFATRVGDFWGRPDLRTGELTGVAPWR